MKEEWKQIEGFGDYYISNLGRVKSCRTSKPKILKQTMQTRGYLMVGLLDANDKHHFKSVHRLVASAFIPNPLGKP